MDLMKNRFQILEKNLGSDENRSQFFKLCYSNLGYRKYRVIVKPKANGSFQQRITVKIYDNSFFLL